MAPAAAVSTIWRADEPLAAGTEKDAVGVQHVEQAEDDSTLRTVDEVLRRRAKTDPNLPVVSYPSSGIDYVDYTFQQLDVFAYRVGKQLQAAIPSRTSSKEKRTVVAMLGPSNLEYLVTMMALFKLGHTVLFLSTRISVPAIEGLIKSTGATYLLADPRYLEPSLATKEQVPDLQVLDMPTRTNFEFPIDVVGDTQLDGALDPSVETNQIVYIIHSSGKHLAPRLHLRFLVSQLTIYNHRIDWPPKSYLSEAKCSSFQLFGQHEHESVHHAAIIPQPRNL